ncbi:hypothetical protein PBY51_018558 [Eleginops maclovinus]|uniref:Uncharacterized protein n=1 Tax=Eleginops maclovinus TaxID=56733 RepID=A0AAN8AUZ9_ELEMC|nr:hypothetical protein PBY51_018558 [Eleginops maclovinus]
MYGIHFKALGPHVVIIAQYLIRGLLARLEISSVIPQRAAGAGGGVRGERRRTLIIPAGGLCDLELYI